MRPTALGALLQGIAWTAMLAAFLLGSLALAAMAVVTLGGIEAARRALRRSRVQVRRILPPRLAIGQTATVRTEATASSDRPLWVEDPADVPLQTMATRSAGGRGHAWQEIDVVAVEAGTARWRTAKVRIADAWGLFEEAREVGAVDAVSVAPEANWVATGRREGARRAVQTLVRGKRHYEATPEVETVREFRPGDRLRDVDWPRSTRMQALHTRVRERVMPRPVIVLVDGSATMRHHRRRAKITTAARIAYGVVAAAQAAGVPAQVMVADERGLLQAGGGRDLSRAMHSLGSLDALVPVDALPSVVEAGMHRQDRGFLGALSSLHAGRVPPAAPLDAAAVALSRRDPALVVAILDAESAPAAADAVVRRLRKAGHDVVLVAPATGAHHIRRAEAHGPTLGQLEQQVAARERLRARLRSVGVPLVSAGPHDTEAVIQEVARWAQ